MVPNQQTVEILAYLQTLFPYVDDLRMELARHATPQERRADKYHHLDRPGLYLGENPAQVARVDMRLPGLPMLVLDVQSGGYLSTYARTDYGSAQRILNFRSLTNDYASNGATWRQDFAQAIPILSKTIAAVANGMPMDGSSSWPESLRHHFETELQKSYVQERWTHWLDRWGNPAMQQAMDMAESLFDRETHFDQWKTLVLSGWTALEMGGADLTADISHNSDVLFGPA